MVLYKWFYGLGFAQVGGQLGMESFLKSQAWTELNVGFALDEGLANPGDEFTVFYGERMPWCQFLIFFYIHLLSSSLFVLETE